MKTYAKPSISWQTLVAVSLGAIALHAVAFFVLGWYLLLFGKVSVPEIVPEQVRNVELDVTGLQELRDQLYPEIELPPVPEEEPEETPQEKPEERSMIDTDGIAAKKKAPDKPAFESDRNTDAASELPRSVTSKDKPLPNHKGEIFERSPNLRDSKFTEEQKGEPSALVPNDPVDQEKLIKRKPEPVEPLEEPKPKPEDDSMAKKPELEKERAIDPLLPLPSDRVKPIPKERKDSESDAEPKPKKPDQTKPEPKEAEETPKKPSEEGDAPRDQEAKKRTKPRRKLQSFSSERSRSQMRGSISRDGPSSVDAINTPMGRYWKNISKSVETEWQKQATKHRDFNMPGTMRISFNVDAKGRVSDLQILSAAGVASIQKGYTMKSIRQAKIPPMPADLRRELKGELVEMIITFNY